MSNGLKAEVAASVAQLQTSTSKGTSDLVADLNTEADLGWLGLVAGALLVLSALLAPRPRRDLELT